MRYLDHAATTQVRPVAAEAFAAALEELGNPSSLHAAGRNSRRGVEEAREQIAEALGAQPAEVVFTSGGTEADNLAVTGMMRGRWRTEPQRRRLVISAIEHPAVLEAAAALGAVTPADASLGMAGPARSAGAAVPFRPGVDASPGQPSAAVPAQPSAGAPVQPVADAPSTYAAAADRYTADSYPSDAAAFSDALPGIGAHAGADVVHLAVDDDGIVRLDALAELLADGSTGLVSVMWGNNETGVLQPVPEIVGLARQHGAWVHSDAVQAVGHVPVNFAESGLDAMTISGHKIGAPIGIGALVVRREVALEAVEHGGGQERGIRSGTVPAPGARSLAAAVTAAVAEQAAESARLAQLRDELVRGVLASVPGARLSGPAPEGGMAGSAGPPAQSRLSPRGALAALPAPPSPDVEDGGPISTAVGPSRGARLPHIGHFTFEGCDADALLFGLDMAGLCASSGSACQAGVQEASHVLLAMGHDEAAARSAVRFSLGWTSSRDDVAAVLAALPEVVDRARAAKRSRSGGR